MIDESIFYKKLNKYDNHGMQLKPHKFINSSFKVLVLRVPTFLYSLHFKNPLTLRHSAASLPCGFGDTTSWTALWVLAWGPGWLYAGALTLVLFDCSFMIWVSVADRYMGRYSTCPVLFSKFAFSYMNYLPGFTRSIFPGLESEFSSLLGRIFCQEQGSRSPPTWPFAHGWELSWLMA